MNEQNPLVSIIVITYNSAKYVLETLESARAQTYQNIELIVTDDCSTDNTVEICREWIEENKERFVRTELITVENNTGLPANCNRGIKVSKGEWVKIIAGDDLLMDKCIFNYLDFVSNSEDMQIICANVIKFNNETEEKTNIQDWKFFSKNISADEQFKLLLRHNRVLASSVFLKKSLIEEMNGFDEQFKLIEDYPMWLKITLSGMKIHCLKECVVKYRLSESGISNMRNKHNQQLIPNILRLSSKVRMKYCLKHLPTIESVDLVYTYLIDSLFILIGNNKTILTAGLLLMSKVFNPFIIYRKLLSLFGIKYCNLSYIIE